jgi:hypothetical protein
MGNLREYVPRMTEYAKGAGRERAASDISIESFPENCLVGQLRQIEENTLKTARVHYVGLTITQLQLAEKSYECNRQVQPLSS